MAVSHTGRLLVAAPMLADPNFRRTVVLVLDHDDDGALGVVLNRPTGVPVSSILASWSGLTSDPGVVFRGGPVSTDSALGLATMRVADDEPLGFRRLYTLHVPVGLVDLDAPPEVLEPDMSGLRIFAGYAGWSPGQLEAEIDEGAWYVVDALPADLFSVAPDRLWGAVLRRQSDRLAFVATYPDDPTLN